MVIRNPVKLSQVVHEGRGGACMPQHLYPNLTTNKSIDKDAQLGNLILQNFQHFAIAVSLSNAADVQTLHSPHTVCRLLLWPPVLSTQLIPGSKNSHFLLQQR